MNGQIRVAQTGPATFVVRCPIHGDASAYANHVSAAYAAMFHGALVFHGEGAR